LRLLRGEALDAVSRESLMTAAEIRRLTLIVVCLDLLAGRLDDPKLCRPWGRHWRPCIGSATSPKRVTRLETLTCPAYLHARHPIRRRADRW